MLLFGGLNGEGSTSNLSQVVGRAWALTTVEFMAA